MTRIAVPGLTIWPAYMGASSPGTALGTAPGVGVLDHANDRVAFVFRVSEDGSITGAAISTFTVSSSQSIDVRLETVSGTHPTGTLATASCSATIASPAANTMYEVTFTASHSAQAGDVLALVVQFTSTAGNVQIATTPHNSGLIMASGVPYVDLNTGAGYVADDLAPAFAIKIGSAYVACASFPCETVGNSSYDSADNPDERGLRFKLPIGLYVRGIYARVRREAIGSSDFTLRLYDASDNIKIGMTFDDTANLTTRVVFFAFGDEVFVPANTVYRIAVLAADTSNVSIDFITVGSGMNSVLNAWPGGSEFYWTERNDGGAWTDVDTKRPWDMGLVVSAFRANPATRTLIGAGV